MESLTLEYAVAEGDPLDRTLSLLARSGDGLVAHRAWRLRDDIRIGSVLLAVDRIVLAWSTPQLEEAKSFTELLEEVERMVAQPF